MAAAPAIERRTAQKRCAVSFGFRSLGPERPRMHLNRGPYAVRSLSIRAHFYS